MVCRVSTPGSGLRWMAGLVSMLGNGTAWQGFEVAGDNWWLVAGLDGVHCVVRWFI